MMLPLDPLPEPTRPGSGRIDGPGADEQTQSLAGAAGTGPPLAGNPPLPRQIGRYYPLERLGAGGMGIVYAAYDPDLDRKVALKLLRPDRTEGHAAARLLREAQAQARISHPHVVQIHDTGLIDGELFLAMEFVRGADLRTWLARGPHGLEARLQAFLAAGRGLAAAHDAGLVHRDFKPENVMVGDDGRVRVTDFGLARQHDAPDEPRRGGTALDLVLTASGDQIGTPAYMSPEQHLGLPVDARSDQFSFCVALWEALYGRRPFRGDTPVTTAAAVLKGELLAPPADARVQPAIEAALRRGLSGQPEQRFPDMPALLAALEPKPPRARRRWFFAGVVGLATAGGLALALTRGPAEAPCSGSATALAGAWDPDRRAALAGALHGTDAPARVLAGLDAWAGAWTEGHRDACLDHQRGEQSSALLDGRMRCLERRRKALSAAVTALAADPAGLDAAQMLARLPQPAICGDPDYVLADVPPPEDPALARAVEAVEAQLAGARAHQHGDDLAGALAQAEAAVAEAHRLGHRPLLAEALLTLGTIRMNLNDPYTARADLREALAEAVQARRDDLAAEAHARRLYLVGVLGGDVAAALDAAPLMLALAGRAPEPHAALGLAYNNLGAVHDARGDRSAAAAATARALVEMTASPQQDPLELGNAMINAAMTTEAADERRARLRGALALFTDHLGPHHRITLDRQQLRAQYEPDPRDALAVLADTCPRYHELARGTSVYCGECWHDLAHFAALLGGSRQAGDALARVADCRRAGEASPSDELLQAKATALAALLAGDGAAALAAADAALRVIDTLRAYPWMDREAAQAEMLRGRALLQLGRHAEAIGPLERASAALLQERASRPALLPELWLERTREDLATARAAASEPSR
ncbi:Serine/threonine protein kinase [Nannocystis exedens]|uniref:Serine/threonine protein kinase n=1 Tax=Nannocystis exedens TaxID=54 RepID=A0A1I2HMM6_9BACT|nr:serine/threonine-protein kinase [Nannocystis exedens]PCC71974.1 Serine/threonine-protein kinase PK-1 [Nannocystis exedens]SFF30550.1 Serine/threonine protein kinase [Nannocystis exedens]